MTTTADRNVALDNFKGFLIVLVIVGHVSSVYLNRESWRLIWCVIYSFHMPAFIAVSGYLSSERKGVLDAARRLLPLYVVAQASWIIYTHLVAFNFVGVLSWLHDIKSALLAINPALWYILSLFFWRTTLPLLTRVVHPWAGVFFLMLAGAVAGMVSFIGPDFSLSRTIVFFPFFAAGFWARRVRWFEAQQSLAGFAWLIIAAALPCSIFVIIQGLAIPELLYVSDPYSRLGLHAWQGILFRAAYYLGAFALLQITWMSLFSRPGFITRLGLNSLSIYLGHVYVLWAAFAYLPSRFVRDHSCLVVGGVLLGSMIFNWIKIGILFDRLGERLLAWVGLSGKTRHPPRPGPVAARN